MESWFEPIRIRARIGLCLIGRGSVRWPKFARLFKNTENLEPRSSSGVENENKHDKKRDGEKVFQEENHASIKMPRIYSFRQDWHQECGQNGAGCSAFVGGSAFHVEKET